MTKEMRGEQAIAQSRPVLRTKNGRVALAKASNVLPTPSRTRWAAAVACLEFMVVAAATYLASFVYFLFVLGDRPPTIQYLTASILIASLHVLICLLDDQYNLLSEKWTRRGISRGAGAAALAFVFFLAITFMYKVADNYSRGTFLSQLAFVITALVITRTILAQRLERATAVGLFQGHALVVISLTEGVRIDDLAAKLCTPPDKILRWYRIRLDPQKSVGSRPDQSAADQLATIQNSCRKLRPDIAVVVFDMANLERAIQVVDALYELPVNIHLLPLGLQSFMQRSRIGWSGLLPTLEITSRPSSLVDRFLKRTLDLGVASVALALLSPVLLLAAIAIKLDSRGPILFRQTRHGFNNEPIEVLKFRTMVTADCGRAFRQTTKNDPRVTRVGRALRRTNIDELPQLFNVIRGEMSVVGPRPHAVAHNDQFAKQIKLMPRRHNVKPGITGWAQIHGLRGETDTYDKMLKRIEYDLYYIDNWSFFLDIKILLLTLLSKRAYSNAY
jgi:Undecaprenyl-phosphate glucose phosphotransferase